jgi:hypothetical protein
MLILRQIEHKINIFRIFKIGHTGHNIFMLNFVHNLNFILQLLDHPQVFDQFFRNYFHRVFFIGIFGFDADHFAVGALAERFHHEEVGDPGQAARVFELWLVL